MDRFLDRGCFAPGRAGSRSGRSIFARALLLLVAVACAGCAADRRTQLEQVAKDWCETIRASQVIPVYPLTADLRPGDVFLVRTSMAQQADDYKQHGFLTLDDHKTRLDDAGYGAMYFDGYFKDPFKDPPHPYPVREAGQLQGAGAGAAAKGSLSDVAAPRAAFPTYTFEVQSGTSGALALPIHGVPLGLNFLNTQQATGSVTIADARTYAGSEDTLLASLHAWAKQPEVAKMLYETVYQRGGKPVLLRVVSRVYLTGSVVISLSRSDSSGGGGKLGIAPDVPPLTDKDGKVNTEHAALLSALNTPPTQAQALADAGGAVQFLSVSNSAVTMSESFDTQMVIGYLGFDVPVYEDGFLGAPVPTFEVLAGRLDPAAARQADSRYEQQLKALEGLVTWSKDADPPKFVGTVHAAKIIVAVAGVLQDTGFDKAVADARKALDAAPREDDAATPPGGATADADRKKAEDAARELVKQAVSEFRDAAEAWFSRDAKERVQTRWFSEVFDHEYARELSPDAGS